MLSMLEKLLISLKAFFFEVQSSDEIICPVCGYFCLGEGGQGCIDKPSLCDFDDHG